MNYVLGIEITQSEAAVAVLDGDHGIRMLQAGTELAHIPRISISSRTGEMLVGQRAYRYCELNNMKPQYAETGLFFDHLVQCLREELHVHKLPPAVLSVRSLDMGMQQELAQAACNSGLRILRCINSAAACVMDLAASAANEEGQLALLLPVNASNDAFIEATVGYGDGIWEILSYAERDTDVSSAQSTDVLRYTGGTGQQKALLSAARGAALLAGNLTRTGNVPDLLLLDLLSTHLNLLKTDGTPIRLIECDTCIPVRRIHTASARDVRDENGKLLFAFGTEYIVSVALTNPSLRMCRELSLDIEISANRRTLLTVSDPAAEARETFILMELVPPDPPAAMEEAEQTAPASTQDEMLQAMLEAMDSLENGLRMLSEEERASSIGKGMLQIHKQFSTSLLRMGVIPIPAEGCLFDPQLHEAVVALPHEKPGWVLQEYRRGYLYHGTLLRAAQVMVAE